MQEKGPKNNEGERENIIKAQAQFDAITYVKLMKEKSPEKLELNQQGKIILDATEAEPILANTRKKLVLNFEEMQEYLISLGEEVEKILKKDNNLTDIN